MSASGSSLTDIGPLEWIREARGRSLTAIAVEGIGGYLLALSGSAIAGLTAVFDLLFLPFRLAIDVGEVAVTQLIIRPLGLTDFGFAISAQNLEPFGLLALPVSTALALFTILIFIGYISLRITGNTVTGVVTDNPIWDFLFQTPEEEREGAD